MDNELVFEYSTCSAFFAVLGMNVGDNKQAKAQFDRMSEKMIDFAISLPGDGIAGVDEEEVAKKLLEEMHKSEADAKRVIRLYAPHCKRLLQAIDEPKAGAVSQ